MSAIDLATLIQKYKDAQFFGISYLQRTSEPTPEEYKIANQWASGRSMLLIAREYGLNNKQVAKIVDKVCKWQFLNQNK